MATGRGGTQRTLSTPNRYRRVRTGAEATIIGYGLWMKRAGDRRVSSWSSVFSNSTSFPAWCALAVEKLRSSAAMPDGTVKLRVVSTIIAAASARSSSVSR